MEKEIICVQNLRKTFISSSAGPGLKGAISNFFSPNKTSFVAVNDISFSVKAGERVAFIGPNGAGKSTTIKILSGILFPTSGEVSVSGLGPQSEREKLAYRIGTVFGQKTQLWFHLPPRDTFNLLAKVYDLDNGFYLKQLENLVRIFDIESFLNVPVRKLSLGQRMRCEIVASLLHKPEILFLDEPTIGLDVNAKASIREIIKRASEEDGTTVLLTSHDTGDMEKVCDRVLMINQGQLVMDSKLSEMRKKYIQSKLVKVHFRGEFGKLSIEGVKVLQEQKDLICCEIDLTLCSLDKFLARLAAGVSIKDLTIEDPPLEEIIKGIYQGQL